MTIENDDDLSALRRVGSIVRATIETMRRALRPGITTAELDEIGARCLAAAGARSAPRLAYDFPGSTCISVNDAIAHGIPGDRVLREGDLVNIDVSAELDGYWADTGASMPVGQVTPAVTALCAATKATLGKAVKAARAGRPLHGIGRVVEREAGRRGYRVIEELAGHGVGRGIHEAPSVFNYARRDAGPRLHKGLVIAIEPFLTKGNGEIRLAPDGWTLRTSDGSLAAQYEHSIVITDGAPIVLT